MKLDKHALALKILQFNRKLIDYHIEKPFDIVNRCNRIYYTLMNNDLFNEL